ncbi:MAG: hypothetical protein AAFP23_12450 [Pseudomonadota bacterium]
MRRPALTAALLLAVLALPACSLFGDDEEELAETDIVEEVQARREQVQRVGKVEIGQLSDGLVVSAFGVAPGAGYANPTLEPRRQGRPGADGFIEFDFIAQPPDPSLQMPVGEPRARILRADRLLPSGAFVGSAGVRVFASGNFSTVNF